MKQLTCEMCGSTDVVKQDGLFVCQVCGCKYSLEEAKKMMIEGIVEVTGTVKIDNSDSLDNYLSMARSACNSGNYREAESYCNRILEMDVENPEAWFIKGKAVGWQSSGLNIRINESINAFCKALANSPEDKQNNLSEECGLEIIKLISALITLKLDNYCKYIREKTEEDVLKIYKILQDIGDLTIIALHNIYKYSNINENIIEKFVRFQIDKEGGFIYAQVISKSMEKAIVTVKNRFSQIEHPDDDDVKRYYGDIFSISLGEVIIVNQFKKYQYDDVDKNNMIINLYKKAIEFSMLSVNVIVYYKRYFNGNSYYHPQKLPEPDTFIKYRKEWQDKISEIQRIAPSRIAAAEKRKIEEYWNSHADEKEKLVSEKEKLLSEKDSLQKIISEFEMNKNTVQAKPYLDDILNRIKSLQNYKNNIPSIIEKTNIETFISDLQNKHSKLGIFKRKEKKEIEIQIENAKKRIPEIQKVIDFQIAEIDAQIAPLESERNRLQSIVAQQQDKIEEEIFPYREKLDTIFSRIREIDEELTKPR